MALFTICPSCLLVPTTNLHRVNLFSVMNFILTFGLLTLTFHQGSAQAPQVLKKIKFDFQEEKAPNSYVGNVAVESGLRAMLSVNDFKHLTFYLDTQGHSFR